MQATAAGHDQLAAVLQQTIKELSTELAHQRGMIEEIVAQLPHPEAAAHDPLAAVLQQTIKELSTELAHQRGMIEEIVSQLPHPEAIDGVPNGAPMTPDDSAGAKPPA